MRVFGDRWVRVVQYQVPSDKEPPATPPTPLPNPSRPVISFYCPQGVADVARRGAELANSAGVINAVSTFVSDATKLLNVSDTTDADNGPVPTTGEWSTGAGGPDDVVTPDTDRIGDPHAIEEDEVEVGVADVGSQEGGSRDDAYPMIYDVRDDLVDLPGFSFETLRSVLRRSELRREGGLRLRRQLATAVLR